MKNRGPIVISAAIVAAMPAASLWALFHIPPGTKIPIHWDVYGNPNGFADGPFALFMTPAMAALIAVLFAAIPAPEPRRLNLEGSALPCNMDRRHSADGGRTWCAALYAAMHAGIQVGGVVIAAVCLLMIVIGNYLGKTRSMFLGGVRTPWTLSSEYSWQRTHSLAGSCSSLPVFWALRR